jgi:hypothetical protein
MQTIRGDDSFKRIVVPQVVDFLVEWVVGLDRFAWRVWSEICKSRRWYPFVTARGPALSEDRGNAQMDDGAQIEPDWATAWDGAEPPTPDLDIDQRVNWLLDETVFQMRCRVDRKSTCSQRSRHSAAAIAQTAQVGQERKLAQSYQCKHEQN